MRVDPASSSSSAPPPAVSGQGSYSHLDMLPSDVLLTDCSLPTPLSPRVLALSGQLHAPRLVVVPRTTESACTALSRFQATTTTKATSKSATTRPVFAASTRPLTRRSARPNAPSRALVVPTTLLTGRVPMRVLARFALTAHRRSATAAGWTRAESDASRSRVCFARRSRPSRKWRRRPLTTLDL